MSKLHLAAWAMLVAALPALTTSAGAAPGFPNAIAIGASHGDYRLVQYGGGGGGGGCDDDCPRPRPHNNNGGGGGNGAAAAGAIINLLGNIARQHQLEQQQKNNEMQRRAIDEQNRRNRAIDDRNRRNRAVEDQNRRNRAAEDERNRRAKQDELDKLRAERQKLEQERKEEAERLSEKKAADDQREKQEKAEKDYEEANGDNDHYEPGEKRDDKLENNVNIIVTIVPHDDRPAIPDVPPLHITPTIELPSCGYVNLPADRGVCVGRTASGGWLRIVNLPTAGGNRPFCVSYCSKPPKIPPRLVVVPKHEDHVVVVPHTNPYVVPTPKPVTPAVNTVKAYPSVVPEPVRKLTPAVTTVQAYPSVVPEPERKLTPAVTTVQAYPSVVPEPERKLTPAVNTVESDPYVVPDNKQPTERELTPAVTTVKASDRPRITPAVLTVAAHPSTQPDPKRPQPKSETPGVTMDAIDADKAQDEPTQPESRQAKLDQGHLDEATPTDNGPPDSKGCTAAGARPLTTAISAPLANFKPPAFSPREVATTAISGIPNGIGGVLSAVTKAFWKDDSSQKLFDAMKNYVDQVVPAEIGKYDKTQLNNDLTAIHKLLSWYDSSWTPSTKGQALSELVMQLEPMAPRFLNPQSPKSTIAEFVTFGTLHLSALRELYDHYDQYYPFDPKDPIAVRNHEHDRDVVRSKLNDAIKEYQDHIPVVRNDIITDRLAKLRTDDRGEVHTGFFSAGDRVIPFSNFGYPMTLLSSDYFSAKDDFCDWQGPEHKNNQLAAWADVARRQAVVSAAYKKLIDEFTAPIARWKPI